VLATAILVVVIFLAFFGSIAKQVCEQEPPQTAASSDTASDQKTGEPRFVAFTLSVFI
jgi:hypothetical protein